jgi:MFS family permease
MTAAPSTTPGTTGLLSGDRRGLTIGLVLAVTLVAFESLAVATILPKAQRDLGGLRFYGWTFSAFLLMSLLGITWAGEQCDRHGPVHSFVAGLVLFAAGLVISGFAPSMEVLVLGRAVQGLGAGAIPAVAYVSIGRGYDDSQRARMLAILSTAWVVPSLLGPAIASLVADYISWRAVFLGLLPLLVVVTILTARPLRRLGPPESPVARQGRLLLSIQLAAGAGLLLGGFSVVTDIAWAGVPLLGAGAFIAWHALRRLLPAGTLRARGRVPSAIAGMGVLNFAFFGAEAYIPFMLTHVRHTSTLFAGVMLTVGALSWTTGAWVQERLTGRVPRWRLIATGLVLLAVGISGMTVVLLDSVPPAFAGITWSFAGLGIGMAYPSFSLTVLGETSEGNVGASSAALKLNEVLGAAIGIGLGGAIVGAAPHSERAAALAVFVIMVAVALCGAALARRVSAPATATQGLHPRAASATLPTTLDA